MSNPTWWHATQRKAGSHLLEPSDDLRFLALALAGEAGELAGLVKKKWRGDAAACGSHWAEKVKGEICDVAAYAFMAACVQGFDLIEETYKKLEEVEQRPEFKALVDRQKLAAKVNKMLGPIPPSELAKMQEKGECDHEANRARAQGSGHSFDLPDGFAEEDKRLRLGRVAAALNIGVVVPDTMITVPKDEFDELKAKAAAWSAFCKEGQRV